MSKKKPPVKNKTKKGHAIIRRKKLKPRAVRRSLREPPRQLTIHDRTEPESVTMIDITSVKKLTTKIIVGKKIGKIEARTQLYSIVGVATGLKTGESNYGAWTALVGRFEAERTADGQLFAAPLVLLPDEASALVIQAIKSANGSGIEFGLVVTAEPTLSSPGYVYDIQMVVSPRKNDMLATLRHAMQAFLIEAAGAI
jgi:hypothetical protein